MSKITHAIGTMSQGEVREAAVEILQNVTGDAGVVHEIEGILREVLDESDLEELGEAFHVA